jgi:hypothetical protein
LTALDHTGGVVTLSSINTGVTASIFTVSVKQMPIGFFWIMQQYHLFRIIALCYRESIKPNQVILHSDNGGPMKPIDIINFYRIID